MGPPAVMVGAEKRGLFCGGTVRPEVEPVTEGGLNLRRRRDVGGRGCGKEGEGGLANAKGQGTKDAGEKTPFSAPLKTKFEWSVSKSGARFETRALP